MVKKRVGVQLSVTALLRASGAATLWVIRVQLILPNIKGKS